MNSQVLTAMNMTILFSWAVTPCGTMVSEKYTASIFRAEEGEKRCHNPEDERVTVNNKLIPSEHHHLPQYE
jgi:hypothetical protein